MANIDVHVEFLLPGNNGGVHHGRSGKLIPHVALYRVVREVTSYRRICLGDGCPDFWAQLRFYRNIPRSNGDLSPGCALCDASRLGIKPPIESPACIDAVDPAVIGV